MRETLEMTVPELDCADEAQQIQATLGRLPGVEEVRTAVGARKAWWPTRRIGYCRMRSERPFARWA